MQASAGPPDTSDADQDEQVWRDVKAETGYSSYKEYLRNLVESGLHFQPLLDNLRLFSSSDPCGEISVLDIQKDGSTVTSFNSAHLEVEPHQSFQRSQSETSRKISSRLLQNLRSPPEDILARIVLWSTPRESNPHVRIIEALGLGLDMDPSFFESLINNNLSPWMRSRNRGFKNKGIDQPRRWRSNQVMIGDSIATIAKQYRRERHTPPVLIIALFFDLRLSFSNDNNPLESQYHVIIDDLLDQEVSWGPSLFGSAINSVPSHKLGFVPSNYYPKLLSKYVYKDCYVDSEADAILLIAVLPLLHLEIICLRGQLRMVDYMLRHVQYDVEYPGGASEEKKEERYNLLDKHRFWLRRRLEGLQESRDAFQEFARSQNAANWLLTEKWRSQDRDVGEVLAMARTKELEVRDYMQLQIGNLSISDSRKSIQLSNQQMNEAKRGQKPIQSFSKMPADLVKVKIRTQPMGLVSVRYSS